MMSLHSRRPLGGEVPPESAVHSDSSPDLAGTVAADVVVVGGGSAALCAAISARCAGATVLVLERAPEVERGGNSKYTRNLRCIRDGLYEEEEFLEDLRGVSDPDVDESMLRLVIQGSRELPSWMEAQGVRWQQAISGSLQLARTNMFFLGGGKALMNVYYARARELGVEVAYGMFVRKIAPGDGRVDLTVDGPLGRLSVVSKAVVVASGGFEANLAWLEEHLGEGARRFAVRGSRFNDGEVLQGLHELGARFCGKPGRAHAIAVDDRSPTYDAGIASRVDSIPFGIVVNREARRFADEGENIWPKRYASWGSLIASQPGQIAFSIFESRHRGRFIPSLFPPAEADSITELARKIGLEPTALEKTVAAFNAATTGDGVLDLTQLDGRGTRELDPPKSNWASPLRKPSFCAYPLRPGITFTYFSLAVNEHARVRDHDGEPMLGLYAAGEATAGNFLSKGYLAGFGVTIGGVVGRIAGEEAAAYAREQQ